jgi:hypothetical protein
MAQGIQTHHRAEHHRSPSAKAPTGTSELEEEKDTHTIKVISLDNVAS